MPRSSALPIRLAFLLATLVLFCLAFPVLGAEPIPDAPAPAPGFYSCNVTVTGGTYTNCSNPVTVINSGTNRRVLNIDLNQGFNWRTVIVRYRVCNASGWTWNVGDSPTNNGYGGDAFDTEHDAEAQALNGTLSVYKSDIGGSSLSCQFVGPSNPSGCVTQQITVQEDLLKFDSNTNLSIPIDTCGGAFLFDFPPYDEADSEDPSGLYADNLYVGLNQVVDGGRVGTGVQRACVFLSTSTNPSTSTVNSECRFVDLDVAYD